MSHQFILAVCKFVLAVVWAVGWIPASYCDPDSDEEAFTTDPYTLGVICVSLLQVLHVFSGHKKSLIHSRGHLVSRTCRDISTIIYELGSKAHQYYCMQEASFWKLHQILHPMIETPLDDSYNTSRKRKRGKTPNGSITSSIRLSCALRYFTGGDPLDIAIVHRISHAEVFRSVWIVVDAIHHTEQLDIKFPTSHEEQKTLATQFKELSLAAFDCCVGAIDGILIWIVRPSRKECEKHQCGPKKFYCGRKKILA